MNRKATIIAVSLIVLLGTLANVGIHFYFKKAGEVDRKEETTKLPSVPSVKEVEAFEAFEKEYERKYKDEETRV